MASKQTGLTIRINGKEVENSFKAIVKEARGLRKELNGLVIGSDEYNKKAAELAKVNNVLNEHSRKLRGLPASYNKMSGALGKMIPLAAGAFAADKILEYGKELFRLGTEMEVLTRKAERVFGQALPQVTAAAEMNAAAMGLTISQYTDAAAAIGDLLVPMGFQRQEAADISTTLVDLSGALSEWTGGQRSAEEVTKILGKAVLGEREQLKELGIGIKEADVQARLAEKGLKGLTGTMLEQAKAAVTLELITEKSADAQAAFAENADTNIRRQAELNARFQDVKETLATALVPVFARLLELAMPIVETFTDYVKAIANGDAVTGKFSATMQFFGTILGNIWKVLKLVGSAFSAAGSFLIDNFGPAFEFAARAASNFYNRFVTIINAISSVVGSDIKLDLIDIDALKAQFTAAEKVVDDSKIDEKIQKKFNPNSLNVNSEKGTDPEAEKAAEKAIKEREKLIKRLQETEAKLREEQRIEQLTEDEQELARIAAKYDKEIELAKTAGAEGIEIAKELERLKGQEIENAIIAQAERKAELESELNEEENARRIERQAALDEWLLTQQEKELQDLERQFFAVATQKGINDEQLLALQAEYERRKGEIIDQANTEQLQNEQEQFQARQQLALAQVELFGSVGEALANILGESAKNSTAFFLFEKGLAAANVIISLQTQLAQIAAKYAAIPGGIAIAAAESTAAKIQAGTRLATIAGTVIGRLVQKKEGGWHNAIGADDGKNYRARMLGMPSSGMLPGHPSLVLASEKGPEYFVANRDLSNPYILRHVQAIDNIVNNRRLPQFAEGGATAQIRSSGRTSSGAEMSDNATMRELTNAVMRLNKILESGVPAIVGDRATVDIFRNFKRLNNASGNALS